jgi:hypothetical protein
VPIPNPTRCCFYEIQESTRNERVAIASTGNILRWARTGGNEQKWLIIPVSDTKCKIMTKQNGEYMSVGLDGNILRWKETGTSTQEFAFVNENQGQWNIQESTRNEYVSVNPMGNVVRWSRSGGKDQIFRLIAVDEKAKPTVRAGSYSPGEIPEAPRLTSYSMPPERSTAYLIGEMALPSVFVNDPSYPDKIRQAEVTPYYILTREQYWERSGGRGYYFVHDGSGEKTEETSIRYGLTTVEVTNVEWTLGLKITHKSDFSFGIDISGGKLSRSSSLSAEFSSTLKVATTNTTTQVQEEINKVTIKLPAGRRLARVGWTLVDRYTLKRMNGTEANRWHVGVQGTFVEDSFSG